MVNRWFPFTHNRRIEWVYYNVNHLVNPKNVGKYQWKIEKKLTPPRSAIVSKGQRDVTRRRPMESMPQIRHVDQTRRGKYCLGPIVFFSSQLRFLDIVTAGGHVMHTLERECPPVIVVF